MMLPLDELYGDEVESDHIPRCMCRLCGGGQIRRLLLDRLLAGRSP